MCTSARVCGLAKESKQARHTEKETDRTNWRVHLAYVVRLPTYEKCQLLSVHLKLLWMHQGCIKAFHLPAPMEMFSRSKKKKKSALIIKTRASTLLVFFRTSFKLLSDWLPSIPKWIYWFLPAPPQYTHAHCQNFKPNGFSESFVMHFKEKWNLEKTEWIILSVDEKRTKRGDFWADILEMLVTNWTKPVRLTP